MEERICMLNLSLEWKVEGVIDGVNEGDDCYEVNQEESEHNEVDWMKKGADSTGNVMHMWKSGWWFVMTKTGHFLMRSDTQNVQW